MFDAMSAWFAAATGPFLRHHPFYAAVLARMVPEEDPAVAVMGVSPDGPRVRLHVNREFFARRRNRKYVAGVLLHEIHHVVLGHLTDDRFAGLRHPELAELAMEISANENIRSPLPGDPPTWQKYESFGIRPGQSTMERYELLAAARGRNEATPEVVNWADDHIPGGVGRVWGGKQPPRLPPPRSQSLLRSLVSALRGDPSKASQPTQGNGATPGLGGGGRTEAVGPAGPLAPFDWRLALRVFRKTVRRREATYQRPSRRLPHLLGVAPGWTRRPGDHPRHLLVAIDTSESMKADELARIGVELTRLRLHARATKLTMVECDDRVRRVYRLRGRLQTVTGRGGTDFHPVFAPAFLGEPRPDGVIYFTDGEGRFPEMPPPVRTLWVLTKPDKHKCPWGHRATLGDRRG